MDTFRFREALASDGPAIRAVVFAVLAEYGLSPDPDITDADLQVITSSYADRGGCFRVILSSADEIVGCGGLYPLDHEEGEIRKMYLVPEARGYGLGLTLLLDLIEYARERGFQRVVLETASVLKEAISLYRKCGFTPLHRDHLASRCDKAFVLDLAVGAGLNNNVRQQK